MKEKLDTSMYYLLYLIIAILCASVEKTYATEDSFGSTFLSSFPKNGNYFVAVIGDEFAEDLHEGLLETLKKDKNLAISPKHFPITGLLRSSIEEKISSLEVFLKQESPNIVLIMMGTSDRSLARDISGKRLNFGSLEWEVEYKNRVDAFLKIFKNKKISVYVLGLPVFRNSDTNEYVKTVNDIYRETTYLNGMKFIDTYASFLDDSGGYTPWGPDMNGKIIKIREGDGQRFSKAGNLMLSHLVERELHRDIYEVQAVKIEPLAGNELEQKNVNPDKPLIKSSNKDASSYYRFNQRQDLNPNTPIGEDIAADNQRVMIKMMNKSGREEDTFVDILRPSLSSSVITLIGQKENQKKQIKINEKLVTSLEGGLVALNTTILPSTVHTEDQFKKTSPSQTSFYKLIIKGERLLPKAGRADDQHWPISQ